MLGDRIHTSDRKCRSALLVGSSISPGHSLTSALYVYTSVSMRKAASNFQLSPRETTTDSVGVRVEPEFRGQFSGLNRRVHGTIRG